MPYYAPAPSLGSKLRDAAFVAERLDAWKPKLIILPFVGFGKELCRYDGPARLIVADNDPGVRALWRVMAGGQLEATAANARELWLSLLKKFNGTSPGEANSKHVNTPSRAACWAAWQHLRNIEGRFRTNGYRAHATWQLMISAGAIGGRRRRNAEGAVNIPYAPTYDSAWLPSRIISPEKARATDAWMKGRVVGIGSDWSQVFEPKNRPTEITSSEVVYLSDEPYGEEQDSVFCGTWTNETRKAVVKALRAEVSAGSKAIVWTGPQDIETWTQVTFPKYDGISVQAEMIADEGWHWRFRKTNTHMKSARTKNNGDREPARKAAGGWIGVANGGSP